MFYVKFKKLMKDAIVPSYKHGTDAGMDFCCLVDDVSVRPGHRVLVSTGLAWEPDFRYKAKVYMKIEGKSGLAIKKGIAVLGGIIDEEYRGEIKIILINHGDKEVIFRKGDAIAQGIVYEIPIVQIKEEKEISTDTDRGEGGFGSTGE
jgi:dUTP pyrophosphatase